MSLLHIVWFSGLTVIGVCFFFHQLNSSPASPDGSYFPSFSSFNPFGYGFLCLAFALLTIHGITIVPLFKWLLNNLPEPETVLNSLSALALTSAACLAFLFAIPLLCFLLNLIFHKLIVACRGNRNEHF